MFTGATGEAPSQQTTSGRRKPAPWLVTIIALAALLAIPAEPALAKRINGTKGGDKIVGTKKADRINGRGGSDRVRARGGGDRVKGARGNDRLAGGKGGDRLTASRGKDRVAGARGKDRIAAGKGADRVVATDGKTDRAVDGGSGNDVCRVDQVDLPAMENCERAKIEQSDNPPDDDTLRVKDASGLTCGTALPLCPFQIVGDRANALVGSVSGHGGVTIAAGAGVSIAGDTWSAAGLYGCSSNGYLKVTIGARSVQVPITCT